ncbi:MAG: Trm112 family protein [archaeon]
MKDPLSEELFRILACPVCKADLKYGKEKKTLVCTKCKQEYEIRDGIPILLPPKAGVA